MPSGRELNVEFNFGVNLVVVMLTHIIVMKMLGSFNGNESANKNNQTFSSILQKASRF
jgi:hypothetical protein